MNEQYQCNYSVMVLMRRMMVFLMCGLFIPIVAVAERDPHGIAGSTIKGNCSQVKCTRVEGCPPDSYRLPSLVVKQSECCPGVSSMKCQCIPDLLCGPKECGPGWVAEIVRNATGKPGGCCPRFECLPKPSGEEMFGDDHQNYHYPPEKLHGANLHPSNRIDSRDVSLSDLSGSLEDDEGYEDDSEEREKRTEKKKSNCFHNGQIYSSGESWTVQSECSQCFCEQGLVSCKPIGCDVPAECRLARAQPLSCCPVCDGCVSATGKVYNTSESWQEDPCTNCTCQGGRIQCHVSMCKRQHSCSNPRHYPGECCPRCENEPPDTGHPHPIGHDKDSCPFRECHRDISCPNGFRLDKSGCPTCECQKCQSLLGCKLSCSRGFKVDGFGCTMCECRDASLSPPSRKGNNEGEQEPSSSQDHSLDVDGTNPQRNLEDHFEGGRYEPHHHQNYNNNHPHFRNDDGDDLYFGYGSNEAKSSSSSTGLILFCTLDSDGVKRMEGEEWQDHCRRCVCRNGKEMCSLITCQAPKCEHPIFYPGDCCPRCPVEETSVSFTQVNVSVCLSSDGRERVEGEIWSLNSCLTCTCHTGQVLCASQDCPPTPCASPKLVDCCLQCPTSYESRKESNKKCLSDDSIKTYLDGETWKVGACQSCRCEDGQIKCFSAGKCPPLECQRPVLAKNQCCPICLGNIHKDPPHHPHHGVEGFEIHHVRDQHQLNHGISTTRGPGGGLEPHCAVLIACLLVVTILLSLYIVRQVCFHRRVSRRLIKKVPVGFHSSSSSSHSQSVTPDCCYKCDYSKYCDTGGCAVVRGAREERKIDSNSRASSTNGSNGHLASEQKPLFQEGVSSQLRSTTPPPISQSLLNSDKV